MQINNWSDLLKSKRLAKTPRDLNNDLVIIGTNTVGNLKKQDTWQPYAMTLADLATAIGGGGGGSGVSFKLLADGFTKIFEKAEGALDYVQKTTAFTPGENSIIKFNTVSIPNGLNWRDTWNIATADYVYNDVVSYVDPGTNIYYTYWMYNDTTPPPAGFNLPIMDSESSNIYWAQLGLQGPAGADGADGTDGTDGTDGENGTRSAYLDLYKWSDILPTTFPSGTSTYTWATGAFSDPTLNGWSKTINAPEQGQTLYKISLFVSNTNTTPDTTTNDWSTYTGPNSIGYASMNGATSVAGFVSTGNVSTFTLNGTHKGRVILVNSNVNTQIILPNLSDFDYPVGGQTMIVKVSNVNVDVVTPATITATGSILGTTLTITIATAGTLYPGATLTGGSILAGTTIVDQLTGTTGGIGTYTVSASQSVGSLVITATTNLLLTSADNMNRLRSNGSGVTLVKENAYSVGVNAKWYMFGDLISSFL